jgi:hypothetical protein
MREEFELVAEMMGVEIQWSSNVPLVFNEAWTVWQPHLPGADCMELMAVINARIGWGAVRNIVSVHTYIKAAAISSEWLIHNNTTADKARAIAEAVFKCAVAVARARKQSEQEKV